MAETGTLRQNARRKTYRKKDSPAHRRSALHRQPSRRELFPGTAVFLLPDFLIHYQWYTHPPASAPGGPGTAAPPPARTVP